MSPTPNQSLLKQIHPTERDTDIRLVELKKKPTQQAVEETEELITVLESKQDQLKANGKEKDELKSTTEQPLRKGSQYHDEERKQIAEDQACPTPEKKAEQLNQHGICQTPQKTAESRHQERNQGPPPSTSSCCKAGQHFNRVKNTKGKVRENFQSKVTQNTLTDQVIKIDTGKKNAYY